MQELILELWRRSRQGSAADPGRAERMRRAKLDPEQRAEVLGGLRRMHRMRRRVDEALGEFLPALPERQRDRARLLAGLLLSGKIDSAAAERAMPGVAWPRVLAADARLDAEPDRLRRLARRYSFPDWLVARFDAAYGAQTEALLQALDEEPPVTLRANRLRTTRDALRADLQRARVESEPTRAPDGLVVTTPVNLFQLDAFRDGRCEAQDEGSQWVASVVAPPPGGTVVDACAGSGGKTLALAALLGGKGRVLALDVAEHRLRELRERARRAGASNVQALLVGETSWPEPVAGVARRASRILVDAPCSGTGALRRHPELRWNLQPADLERLIATQLRLLQHAAAHLRAGARLIYATCSLLPEENEQVVGALLAARPELRVVPIKEILGGELGRELGDERAEYLKLRPDRHGTDGFFAAVLR